MHSSLHLHYSIASNSCFLNIYSYVVFSSCNASFLDAFNQTQQFQCLEPLLKLSNHTRLKHVLVAGYQVVTKCPETFPGQELKRRCENPDLYESTPFVEGNDNKTYRNMECALCNAIRNWTIWHTSLSCPNSTLILTQERLNSNNFSFSYKERELIRNTCEVKMNPPNNARVFECRIVLECQNKTNPDYVKCIFYKQQLYSWTRPVIVRNPHCARCMGTPFIFLSLMKQFFGGGGKKSLAILFDFSKASQIYGAEETDQTHICPKGELYDFQQNSCRKRLENEIIPTRNWTCEFQNETFPNSSTHIVVYENSSIFVRSHRQLYEPKNYYWYKANVIVCGNFTKQFSKLTESPKVRLYSKAEFNLTVVGYTLSVLALLLVLLTYSIFNELRTLPGKITMNLSVALLLSQVVFLVDMYEEFSGGHCRAVSVILHYLYLSSFCWMSVLAFDVAKTFSSQGELELSKILKHNCKGSNHSSYRRKLTFTKIIYLNWIALVIQQTSSKDNLLLTQCKPEEKLNSTNIITVIVMIYIKHEYFLFATYRTSFTN